MDIKDCFLLASMMPMMAFAEGVEESKDSTIAKHFDVEEVTVVGFKQDKQDRDPVAVTSLSEAFVHNTEMLSIKDLGYTVPNFYIPEYGTLRQMVLPWDSISTVYLTWSGHRLTMTCLTYLH